MYNASSATCSRCGAPQQSTSAIGSQPDYQFYAQSQGAAAAMAPALSGPVAAGYAEVPEMAYTGYAGFWIRVVANFVDSLVTGAVITPIWIILLGGTSILQAGSRQPNIAAAMGMFVTVLAVFAVATWLYYAGMESSSKQATIGKMLFGLRVADATGGRISFGRATARLFVKTFLSGILCIGYLMVAFTARKQGLHDMLAGTFVMTTR